MKEPDEVRLDARQVAALSGLNASVIRGLARLGLLPFTRDARGRMKFQPPPAKTVPRPETPEEGSAE